MSDTNTEAELPTEAKQEAQPGKTWDDAQFRAVTRERSEWRNKAQQEAERAKALEDQLTKITAETRKKNLEWDVLRGIPEDRHEPARHLLLGVATAKGLDFTREIDADTSAAMREYVASQFGAQQVQQAKSAAITPPQAPPMAQPPAPVLSANHDWSRQETLNGLTNDQRMQFARSNPTGYQRALRSSLYSR